MEREVRWQEGWLLPRKDQEADGRDGQVWKARLGASNHLDDAGWADSCWYAD